VKNVEEDDYKNLSVQEIFSFWVARNKAYLNFFKLLLRKGLKRHTYNVVNFQCKGRGVNQSKENSSLAMYQEINFV
jgi:hypothetical protein